MSGRPDLIVQRREGLYCPAGDFFIDPWRAVSKAVITHAHADHARRGHGAYLCSAAGEHVLRARLGRIALTALAPGEAVSLNGVRVSLHAAGHVLGSAQVRVEHDGEVWVASGDYFVSGAGDHNPTCEPFEPVRCHTFITEATFGLPVYRWAPQAQVLDQINAWWQGNADQGRISVLMAYSFGKAQRLLAGLDATIGPIAAHDTVRRMNEAYAASGVVLPQTDALEDLCAHPLRSRALVVMPPGASGLEALARLGDVASAFASGWMQLRTARQRLGKGPGSGRGFVLSDHADWPGLQQAIAATQAERVIVTHGANAGQESVMVRWLEQQGLLASRLQATNTQLEIDEGSDVGDGGDGGAGSSSASTSRYQTL